jgi:hypothetical protein
MAARFAATAARSASSATTGGDAAVLAFVVGSAKVGFTGSTSGSFPDFLGELDRWIASPPMTWLDV